MTVVSGVVCKLSGFTEGETLKTWTAMLAAVGVFGLVEVLIFSKIFPAELKPPDSASSLSQRTKPGEKMLRSSRFVTGCPRQKEEIIF